MKNNHHFFAKGDHIMIIVCPECSTTFNVNADRIPETGAKVRCARCKHVFFIEKTVEQDLTTETIVQEEVPTTSVGNNESNFSYDKFQELDSAPDAETKQGTEASKKLDSNTSATPPKDAIADVAEDIDINEQPANPEFPEKTVPNKKGGPIASIIRILLLLIMAIIIIGGVFVYINGTDQLNKTIQQLIGQQTDRPVQTGQITLTELEGKFILNKQAGELFLISGLAVNNYSEARAAIQVKGIVFDPNGKPLRQKTVYCGNAIDDKDLLTLSFAELEHSMGNQFGKDLSNMKVNSKQQIPFDIIFKDLPKNLSEFSVKVTSSTPANK